MRWDNARPSVNIKESSPPLEKASELAVGGGLGTVVFIIIALLFGVNPMSLLEQVNVLGSRKQRRISPSTI